MEEEEFDYDSIFGDANEIGRKDRKETMKQELSTAIDIDTEDDELLRELATERITSLYDKADLLDEQYRADFLQDDYERYKKVRSGGELVLNDNDLQSGKSEVLDRKARDFAKNLQGADKELYDEAAAELAQDIVKKKDDMFSRLQEKTSQTLVTKEKLDQAQNLMETQLSRGNVDQATIDAYKYYRDEYSAQIEEGGQIGKELMDTLDGVQEAHALDDKIGRNYEFWDRAGLGAKKFGKQGGVMALQLAKWSTDLLRGKEDPSDFEKNLDKNLIALNESLMADNERTAKEFDNIRFDQADSLADYLDIGLNGAADNVGNMVMMAGSLALAVGSGGTMAPAAFRSMYGLWRMAAPAVMASTSGGAAVNELYGDEIEAKKNLKDIDERIEKATGAERQALIQQKIRGQSILDRTELQKFTYVAQMAGYEYLGEKFLGAMAFADDAIYGSKLMSDLARKNMNKKWAQNYVKNQIKSPSGIRKAIYDKVPFAKSKYLAPIYSSIEEGVEEGATQIMQNFAAVNTGINPSQNILEGVGEAFYQGAFMGILMGGTSAPVQAFVQRGLQTTDQQTMIRQMTQEIGKIYEELDSNPNITEEGRTKMIQTATEKAHALGILGESNFLDVLRMTPAEIKELADIEAEVRDLGTQVSQISESNMSEDMQKALMDDIDAKVQELDKRRDGVINKDFTLENVLESSDIQNVEESRMDELTTKAEFIIEQANNSQEKIDEFNELNPALKADSLWKNLETRKTQAEQMIEQIKVEKERRVEEAKIQAEKDAEKVKLQNQKQQGVQESTKQVKPKKKKQKVDGQDIQSGGETLNEATAGEVSPDQVNEGVPQQSKEEKIESPSQYIEQRELEAREVSDGVYQVDDRRAAYRLAGGLRKHFGSDVRVEEGDGNTFTVTATQAESPKSQREILLSEQQDLEAQLDALNEQSEDALFTPEAQAMLERLDELETEIALADDTTGEVQTEENNREEQTAFDIKKSRRIKRGNIGKGKRIRRDVPGTSLRLRKGEWYNDGQGNARGRIDQFRNVEEESVQAEKLLNQVKNIVGPFFPVATTAAELQVELGKAGFSPVDIVQAYQELITTQAAQITTQGGDIILWYNPKHMTNAENAWHEVGHIVWKSLTNEDKVEFINMINKNINDPLVQTELARIIDLGYSKDENLDQDDEIFAGLFGAVSTIENAANSNNDVIQWMGGFIDEVKDIPQEYFTGLSDKIKSGEISFSKAKLTKEEKQRQKEVELYGGHPQSVFGPASNAVKKGIQTGTIRGFDNLLVDGKLPAKIDGAKWNQHPDLKPLIIKHIEDKLAGKKGKKSKGQVEDSPQKRKKELAKKMHQRNETMRKAALQVKKFQLDSAMRKGLDADTINLYQSQLDLLANTQYKFDMANFGPQQVDLMEKLFEANPKWSSTQVINEARLQHFKNQTPTALENVTEAKEIVAAIIRKPASDALKKALDAYKKKHGKDITPEHVLQIMGGFMQIADEFPKVQKGAASVGKAIWPFDKDKIGESSTERVIAGNEIIQGFVEAGWLDLKQDGVDDKYKTPIYAFEVTNDQKVIDLVKLLDVPPLKSEAYKVPQNKPIPKTRKFNHQDFESPLVNNINHKDAKIQDEKVYQVQEKAENTEYDFMQDQLNMVELFLTDPDISPLSKSMDPKTYNSVKREIENILNVVRKQKDKGFFIKHNFDFRGRLYQQLAFGGYQGNKIALSFYTLGGKNKKPMGKKGWKATLSMIADLAGFDGMSRKEREAWGQKNLPRLIEAVKDPLNHKKVWEDADNKYLLSAILLEANKALESGNPLTYETGLILHADATTSGPQIYAALTKDFSAGEITNITKTDQRKDLYLAVADLVWNGDKNARMPGFEQPINEPTPNELEKFRKIRAKNNAINKLFADASDLKTKEAWDKAKDAARKFRYSEVVMKTDKDGKEVVDTKASTRTEEWAWLQDHGPRIFWGTFKGSPKMRKLVKGPIMTLYYSATAQGQVDGLMKQAADLGVPDMTKADATFLVNRIREGAKTKLPGAAALMDRLSVAYKEIGKLNLPVEAEMPYTKFKFIQEYHKAMSDQVKLKYKGAKPGIPEKISPHAFTGLEEKVNFRKMGSSAAPNTIHAFDGQLVSYAILESPFAVQTIHDSFGSHPADYDEMNAIIRKGFNEILGGDSLKNFLTQVRDNALKRAGDNQEAINRINEKLNVDAIIDEAVFKPGDPNYLDVASVMQNEYAFGAGNGREASKKFAEELEAESKTINDFINETNAQIAKWEASIIAEQRKPC